VKVLKGKSPPPPPSINQLVFSRKITYITRHIRSNCMHKRNIMCISTLLHLSSPPLPPSIPILTFATSRSFSIEFKFGICRRITECQKTAYTVTLFQLCANCVSVSSVASASGFSVAKEVGLGGGRGLTL
jgi:hypothetical protein